MAHDSEREFVVGDEKWSFREAHKTDLYASSKDADESDAALDLEHQNANSDHSITPEAVADTTDAIAPDSCRNADSTEEIQEPTEEMQEPTAEIQEPSAKFQNLPDTADRRRHTLKVLAAALVASIVGSGLVAVFFFARPANTGYVPKIRYPVTHVPKLANAPIPAQPERNLTFAQLQEEARKEHEASMRKYKAQDEARRDKDQVAQDKEATERAKKEINQSFKKMIAAKGNKSVVKREMDEIAVLGKDAVPELLVKFDSADEKVAKLAGTALARLASDSNRWGYYHERPYNDILGAIRNNHSMRAVAAFFAGAGKDGVGNLESLLGLGESKEVQERTAVLLASTLRTVYQNSKALNHRTVSLGGLNALMGIYKTTQNESVREAVVYCLQYGPGPSQEVIDIASDAEKRNVKGAQTVLDELTARKYQNDDVGE